jgi:hypothetical protein
MRDGDAIAHAGGAEPLALQNDVKHFALGKPGDFRSLGRQFLQQLFLGVCLERGQNRVLRNQISKRHVTFLVSSLAFRRYCSHHVKAAGRRGSIGRRLPALNHISQRRQDFTPPASIHPMLPSLRR